MKYLIDSKINFFLWRYLPLPIPNGVVFTC